MKLTKTTALKGALLMVLAANVSWEHLEFGSTQLASDGKPGELVTGDGAAKSAAPTGDGIVSTAPAVISVTLTGAGPQPVTVATIPVTAVAAAPAVVAKPSAAPAVTAKALPHEYTENGVKLCGEDYSVTYRHAERGGRAVTEVIAYNTVRKTYDAAIPLEDKDLLAALAEKSATNKRLEPHVRSYRTLNKLPCGSSEVVATTTVDKEELAEDIKSCNVDLKGKEVKKADQLRCWTKLLASIDKRIPKKNAEGKRIKEEERTRDVLSEIKRIHGEIKRDLRSELNSKDETRVSRAKDDADAAMDELVALGDKYDLGSTTDRRGNVKYNNTISKMVREISALKHGAEVRQEADMLKQDAESVKENMNETYRAALNDPLNPQRRYEHDRARNDYFQLLNYIDYDFKPNFMQPLQNDKANGYLSKSDYDMFSKPFDLMLAQMREAANPMATSSQSRTNFSGRITDSVLRSDYDLKTLADRRAMPAGLSSTFSGSSLSNSAPTINLPALPAGAFNSGRP